jgi:hypothetical protein
VRSCSLLFRAVLDVFYGTIVVENAELRPAPGEPWYVRAFFRMCGRAQRVAQHCVRESHEFTD